MSAILVPIDGSKQSLRAADYAMKQAAAARATVHLLNVQPARDDYGMVRAYLSEKKHRALAIAHARDLLHPLTKRAGRARVASREHVALGDPAAEIVRTARRLRCRSIVMGSRGMGAVGNILLGSVASKVSHLARVPVTLVR